MAGLTETKIAWASFRDGNGEIYVADQDGANPRRLTTHGEGDRVASWSSDGTRVLFARGDGYGDLYIANADGSAAVQLSQDVNVTDNYAGLSPDGTKIVFASAPVPGNADVYTMNADGSGRVNLTSDGANSDSAPHWSHDGAKIAFMSRRDGDWEVYVMDADGGNQTRLTVQAGTDAAPRWSPDDSQIAFYSDRDGNSEIYVMAANGTAQTRVTNTPTEEDYDPSWSPDGLRFVFVSVRSSVSDIYTIHTAGGTEVQITNDASQDQVPRWSPYPLILEAADGAAAGTADVGMSSTTTFTVKNHDAVTALSVSGITSGNAVFSASPASFTLAAGLTQTVTVTYSPVAIGSDAATITVAHDGPMGSSVIGVSGSGVITPPTGDLAHTKVVFRTLRNTDSDVYMANADGSDQINLTASSTGDSFPAWTPDGSRVVFQSERGGDNEIYIMDADGSNPVNLTNNAASDAQPVVSPDGTKIAFVSFRDGWSEIYSMGIDGSAPVNLTINVNEDASPSWVADGSKIVFRSNRDGNAEVYIMDADGSNQVNLTNNTAGDDMPSVSPDGSRIAFHSQRDSAASGGEIYTMDLDGGNVARLTSTTSTVQDHDPAWSPDGTKILWQSSRDGNKELYTMLADGSVQTNITNDAGMDIESNWSPFLPIFGVPATLSVGSADLNDTDSAALTVSNTGSGVLVVSGITSDSALFSASPTSFTVPAGGTQDVTVSFSPTDMGAASGNLTITHNAIAFAQASTASVAVDGNGVITPRSGDLAATTIVYGQGDFNIATITYDGTTEASLTPDGVIEYNPDWSPDGTKIVYSSLSSGIPGLFLMNPDGTGVTALTPGLDENENDPVWSPDGSRIAFSRKVIATGLHDLYTMAADGSDIVAVTTDGGAKGLPSWSPDGTRLVFRRKLSATADSNDIYVINVDGTGEVRLTDNAVEELHPAWSPDGAQIAYVKDINGAGSLEIFLMNADGTNPTNITNNAVYDSTPAWSPDGTRIAFQSKRDGQDKNDLYHMLPDGTDVVRLTTSGTHDTSPSWGPFPSTATVTAIDTQAQVGKVVTVPINITDVRGLDVTGVTITLTYDPAIITPQNDGANTTAVTAGSMIPANWTLAQNVITAGTLSFSMAGGFNDPITGVGGGTLASVAFDVSGSATVGATSALTITEGNLNEGGVASTLVSGTLTVMMLKYGDVTGDDDITAYDASWVLEYVAKDAIGQTATFPIESTPPTWATIAISQTDAFSVADVDANATLQGLDGSLILQHDVDLISTFAAESAAPSRTTTSPPAYQLTAEASSERPDARITVSLDASAVEDLYGGELGLEFDARILRPVRVYLDRGRESATPPMLVQAEDEGRLGIAFASAKPIAASAATLNVVFEPVGAIDGPVDSTIRSSRLGLNATRVDPSFEYRYHIEPFRFQALANYPNPFNPETWIPFELNEDSDVTIHIYGLDGQRVRTLEVGSRAIGVHAGRDAAAYWDGRNAFGEAVSSGIYVYELIAGSQRAMRRMVVLK